MAEEARPLQDGGEVRPSWLPTKAFIQTFEGAEAPPPDFAAVADVLQDYQVPVVFMTSEQLRASSASAWPGLDRDAVVVGDFDWTRRALRALGVPAPAPPDYPECLRDLLRRRVWRSTLGDVLRSLPSEEKTLNATSVFVKPAEDAKLFSAIVEPQDQMLDFFVAEHGAQVPVWCSDVVAMGDEYRVYVVAGAVRAVCRYIHRGSSNGGDNNDDDGGQSGRGLDMETVAAAVATFVASDEGRTVGVGCALDFTLLPETGKTALIEVNDGVSLGRYEGLAAADYAELLCRRWRSIVRSGGPL